MKNYLSQPDEDILFYAFRYALGRRTGAVEQVATHIIKNWTRISERTQRQIHDEIKVAIERDQAGSQCDVEEWERVLKMPVEIQND